MIFEIKQHLVFLFWQIQGLVSWFGPFLYCKAVICIANWYIHHCSPVYCGMHQLCTVYNGGHSHHYWTGVWTKLPKDNQRQKRFCKYQNQITDKVLLKVRVSLYFYIISLQCSHDLNMIYFNYSFRSEKLVHIGKWGVRCQKWDN